jgi:hypothetical protein
LPYAACGVVIRMHLHRKFLMGKQELGEQWEALGILSGISD